MQTTIYDKILAKGDVEVERILTEAKLEAKKIEDDIVKKAKKQSEDRIKKAESEANKLINHQTRLLELEKRQALLTAKQTVIKEIFDEVLNKLTSFEGKELLDFVVKLIKEQKTNGNEVIHVRKEDYNKYLKALSSSKKAKLVDLDLLNKKLDTKFKLSNEAANIKDGFLLEGDDFDLNFSITNLVDKLRLKNEQKIAKELFE